MLIGGGKLACAEFGFKVSRGSTGRLTGSLTVVCDTATGDKKFKSSSITGLTILGNTASFQAPGTIFGSPVNTPTIANVTVTDNEDVNDAFAVTLKVGTKTMCIASNAVKGDIEVLVGHNTDPDAAAGASRPALVEHLIASTRSPAPSTTWPLALLLSLLLGAGALSFRKWRTTTK